ncbi:MAG: DUF6056 family protein [Clostridiales bacterium]|nr:DUF6056 family protein [Clostridiales bacterium]MDY4037721.1 DUF6056 family protein [Candidatus Pseudoscilispira sp.]
MAKSHTSRLRIPLLLTLAALLAALLALSALFPVTGDDWYRETVGRNLHTLSELAGLLIEKYQTTNPRLLGNLLAYCAGGHTILRAVLRGGILFVLVLAAAKNINRLTPITVLLTFAALLVLPQAMFAQVYPWAAGFFNYVPPVATTLLFFVLARPVFEKEPMRDAPGTALAAFLLGFSGQLFIEHSTLYALLASVLLLAWYFFEQHRFSFVLFSNTAGCVLGAALLFLSPAYRTIGNEDNAYTMETGLQGFLNTARENLPDMLQSLIETSPVLYLSLAALCLFFFFSLRKKRWGDVLLAAVITAAALWYLAGQLLGGPAPTLKLRVLIALIWGLTLLLSCLLWVPEGLQRRRAVFFLFSAAAAAAPLAVVSPIGPRCLFLSYVLLLLAAGNLLQAALENVKRPTHTATAAAAVLAAVIWIFYIQIYFPIHQAEIVRECSIAQAMARGETEITVVRYPNGAWLWEPESQKMGEEYFYETPHDITFVLVNAEG